MRKVGQLNRIPSVGAGFPDAGIEEDFARIDHTHQLWEPWTLIPLSGTWTGECRVTKCNDLVMLYVSVSGAAASGTAIFTSNDFKAGGPYYQGANINIPGWIFGGTKCYGVISIATGQLTCTADSGAGIVAVTSAFLLQFHALYRTFQ